MLHVGDVVRRLRKNSGLTIQRVSAATGISKTTISQLERGGDNFERETLRRIARAIGSSEAEIYSALRAETDEPKGADESGREEGRTTSAVSQGERSEQESRVPDDPYLRKIERLYGFFVDEYGDDASREELYQKLRAAMEDLLAEKRRKRGRVKNL